MANLASTDVTVTPVGKAWIAGGKKYQQVSIAYGNATLLYPVGGIPLPDFTHFGLRRNLDQLIFTDKEVAGGFSPDWDKSAGTLKLFAETTVGTNQPLIEGTNALAPAATVIGALAVGW